MIGQHHTFLVYCISCAVTWSQESYKLEYMMTLCFWTCSSVNMFLEYKWETKHIFLTPKLITYNVLDIHVAIFEPVLFFAV